jgi:uncharacterized protein (TIGR02231 family)
MKHSILFAVAALLSGTLVDGQTPVSMRLRSARLYQEGGLLTYEAVLPASAEVRTFRLHGLGSVTKGSEVVRVQGSSIRSRNWNYVPRFVPDAELVRLDERLDSVSAAVRQCQRQHELIQSQHALLTASAAASAASPANLDLWNARVAQLLERQHDANDRARRLEARSAELTELRALRAARYPERESVLELERMPSAKETRLEVTVLDHSVRWLPSHAVYVDESGSALVRLDATLEQQTGWDWNAIPVTLVTGTAGAVQGKPVLTPWVLGAPMVVMDNLDLSEVVMKKARAESIRDDDGYSMAQDYEDQGVSMEFPLAEAFSLRSGGEGRVVLRSKTLQARLTFYAAPRIQESVFALAEFPDWAQAEALPVPYTLYYKDQLVSEGILPDSRSLDTLVQSLGEDLRVKVTFDATVASERKGTARLERHSNQIKLVNPRSEPITLVVEDRSPVSRTSELEVVDGEWGGAQRNPETGILRWSLTLGPKEARELKYRFTIKRTRR